MDNNEVDDRHAAMDTLFDEKSSVLKESLGIDTNEPIGSAPPFLTEDVNTTAQVSQEAVSFDCGQETDTETAPQVDTQNANATTNDLVPDQESSGYLPGESGSTGEEESPDCSIEQYGQRLEVIIGLLESLSKDFQTRILKAERESQVIDQMHSELQIYKSDLYSKLTMPILKEIITLREHMLKLAADCLQKPEEEQHIPLKTFSSFISFDLTQILEDNGIEVFSYEVGDAFDPQRQKVVSKVGSDNPELNKTIARTIGEGYSHNGRTLSAQKVDVYSYSESIINDDQQGKEEDNG